MRTDVDVDGVTGVDEKDGHRRGHGHGHGREHSRFDGHDTRAWARGIGRSAPFAAHQTLRARGHRRFEHQSPREPQNLHARPNASRLTLTLTLTLARVLVRILERKRMNRRKPLLMIMLMLMLMLNPMLVLMLMLTCELEC